MEEDRYGKADIWYDVAEYSPFCGQLIDIDSR
jgi:hypothetical protein